ncbi:30S ribosomal protein S16 [Candidatus Amesbacteria bacterium RIFOXYB1_FULL_44_23]|uniref:30S ribosomal protein S16 n=1 Tax=Candidatus Amesbacteria bacterium RIFOXYB1_FULL_44_23 TaxID=1797263 RepID=A0A1F4ZYX6_9BACT|nr:MAG: 30S ribosomal protein S16 [Candidatus Amesbacteria bacterium RIFOXYB1_FULL_44_23]
MLKIKLQPFGKKNAHTYRIVVAEENTKLTGNCLANLGHYIATSNSLTIDKKMAQTWIAKGAIPTDRVKKLLATK